MGQMWRGPSANFAKRGPLDFPSGIGIQEESKRTEKEGVEPLIAVLAGLFGKESQTKKQGSESRR